MSKIDHFVSERQTLIFAELQSKGRVLAQDLARLSMFRKTRSGAIFAIWQGVAFASASMAGP